MGLLEKVSNMGLSSSPNKSLPSRSRAQSSVADKGATASDGADVPGPIEGGDDVEVLDEKQGNVLLSLIAQLRPGVDLSKVALPTFVLEPRSMLERITDFFSHPDLIFGAANLEAQDRFIAVLRYYLSGWHIKPNGVKKPYNSTLGEIFRCAYKYPDGSVGFYVAEQVSHHPPVSAYFYISPQNGVLITGELKPKSKFLGNSAATIMDGHSRVRFMDKPEDGEYEISMPNMYARGILFGKMILELGDTSTVKNEKLDICCDVEFKTKGFFSGTYNAVAGKVTGPKKAELGDISGKWNTSMEFRDAKSGDTSVLFSAQGASVTPKIVAPESAQELNESRRQWAALTKAIKASDMEGATEAKNIVEERQRQERKSDEEQGTVFKPSFFEKTGTDTFMPLLDLKNLPKEPVECVDAIKKWIWAKGSCPLDDGVEPSIISERIEKNKKPNEIPTEEIAVPTAPGPPKEPVSEIPPPA